MSAAGCILSRDARAGAWLVLIALGGGRALAQEQGAQPGYQWGYSFNFREFGAKGDRFLRSGGTIERQQIVDALGVSLSFTANTSRLALSFAGSTSGQHFRKRSDLDRVSYSISASGSYRLTPRASLVFGQALGSGFDLDSLATLGTIYPEVSVVSNASTVGIHYRLSQHTTTSASYTYSWLDYQAPGLFDGSEVLPGVLAAETALATDLPLPEPEPAPEGGVPPPESDPFEPGRLSPDIVDSSQFLLNLLAREGFSVARVKWRSSHGAAGISHQLSPATTLGANVSYGWNDFDNDRLVDGAELAASALLSRRLGERASLSLNYGYSQSQSQEPVVRNHSVYGGWGRALGRRSSLSASLGVNYFQAAGDTYSPSLRAGAGYTTRFRRGGVSLSYDRSAYLATGFGQNRLTDQATADLGLGLTRKLYWGVFAGYLRSQDQQDPDRWFGIEAVGTRLGFDISRQLELGATYVYRVGREPGASRELESQLWSFYLSYGSGRRP